MEAEPHRRIDGRAATDFLAEIYHADGQTLRGIARLLDLSESGTCLDSTSEWTEGEDLVVRVLLDPHLLSLSARVIWKRMFSKTYQYGLRWGACSDENRGLIRSFVQDYEKRLHKMAPKIVYKK